MGGFNFLNLEYILLRTFDILGGANLGSAAANLPVWFGVLFTLIIVLGLFLALILLVLSVYAQIRLVQVEHAGFHAKEEHHYETQAVGAEDKHNDRWRRIVELASSPSESDWRRAILEADIMLGQVLNELGYVGESVGEQLRLANPIQLTSLDLAWKAHKVRNEIAHAGEGYALQERDVRTTVDYYRRVFEEAGVI